MFLMLKQQTLLDVLACMNLTQITYAKKCVDNFYNLFNQIEASSSFTDLKESKLQEFKKLTGVTNPLKAKQTFAQIKSGKSKLAPDVLNTVKVLLNSSDSYNSAQYLVLKPTDRIDIPESRISLRTDTEIKIQLTSFQVKLLNWVASNFSIDGDLDLGIQVFSSEIEKIKASFKSQTLWGYSLTKIKSFERETRLLKMINSNIVDMRNKYNQLEIFKKQYLTDESYLKNVTTKLFELYPDIDCNNENFFNLLISRFADEYVNWTYSDINHNLDTNLDEYSMLMQFKELESLGFIGIWPTSRRLKILIKDYSIVNKEVAHSKIDLENNSNIRFLLDVISPLLEGEIKYDKEAR